MLCNACDFLEKEDWEKETAFRCTNKANGPHAGWVVGHAETKYADWLRMETPKWCEKGKQDERNRND